MDIESSEAVLVLADELEERGDPRAELVRAQVQGREHGELFREHWSQWVGTLEPRSALLRWKWGHLVEVGVRAAPAGWAPEELLRKPTTEFLTRLALGPKVSSRGVEHARGLRHLICFGSLESGELPAVETLTLDLDGAGAQLLPSLVAPRLTALHTRVTAQDEGPLLKSLARAPWFSGLQTWTHRVAATESLAALLANGPLLSRGGAGLLLLCDEPVLQAITEELRRALPRAKFSLLPTPKRPHDPEDFHGPMRTHVVPVSAPMDFRARPTVEQASTTGSQSDEPVVTSVGSGFPLGKYLFSTCSWCGSANTLGIWSETWSLYSHFETTRYADWEYECDDCGLFTAMRSGHTH
jgi:uncharacterized protein (TIGR02996 family)